MGVNGWVWSTGGRIIFGAVFLAVAPLAVHEAAAAKPRHVAPAHGVHMTAAHVGHGRGGQGSASVRLVHSSGRYLVRNAHYRYAYAPRLQCVAFARSASGIVLSGNAANWWDAAAGVYARGNAPEPGSVLNFRSTGHMRLGHVAVVTAVNGSREIEIEHANWAGPGANRGGVSRDVRVIDVSQANDWTAVRVSLGGSGDFGSIYPTYGFIYDRPDNGARAMTAGAGQVVQVDDELAQAGGPRRGTAQPLNLDGIGEGPMRSLR